LFVHERDKLMRSEEGSRKRGSLLMDVTLNQYNYLIHTPPA
jgi:hypothetical protein